MPDIDTDFHPGVRMAIKACQKSRHHSHKLGCVIIKGGTIISAGWNIDVQHAEHTAINRAWRSNIDGAIAIVVRIRKDGSIGLAKPCITCLNRLIDAGIKKVTYTTNSGGTKSVKLQSGEVSQALLQYTFFNPFTKNQPKEVRYQYATK